MLYLLQICQSQLVQTSNLVFSTLPHQALSHLSPLRVTSHNYHPCQSALLQFCLWVTPVTYATNALPASISVIPFSLTSYFLFESIAASLLI